MSTDIYAVGLFYVSACTDDSDDVATQTVNHLCPSDQPWKIANEPFHSGEPNPHPCEGDSGRRHLLFRTHDALLDALDTLTNDLRTIRRQWWRRWASGFAVIALIFLLEVALLVIDPNWFKAGCTALIAVCLAVSWHVRPKP